MFKKHPFRAILFLVLGIAALYGLSTLLPTTAFAAGPFGGAGARVDGDVGDVIANMTEQLGVLNTFMHILLLIVMQLLEFLLKSDYYSHPNILNSLGEIWRLCRDIMNLLFALMLIGVAFYTIITAKTELIKTKWTQFAIGVVAVNLSWFFPRVIIDVANILTATIYSVPSMISFDCQSMDDVGNLVPCKVVVDIKIFGTGTEQSDWYNTHGCTSIQQCPCTVGIGCVKYDTYNNATYLYNGYAILNGLASSFVKFDAMAKLPAILADPGPSTVAESLKTSIKIFFAVMMGLVLQLATLLPMIGMAIGFTARILILWVTTAMMPFTFIGYVVTGKLTTNVFDVGVDIWKDFINAAFMPAFVAVPMVIGIIMVSAGIQLPVPTGMSPDYQNLVGGIGNWWGMLWALVAAFVIYKGTFAALKKNQWISGMIGKLEGYGNYIAGAALKAPLLTPIPLSGGKKVPLGTIVNAPKQMATVIDSIASGRTTKTFGEAMKDAWGGGGSEAAIKSAAFIAKDSANRTKKIADAITALRGTSDATARLAHMKAIRDSMGDSVAGQSDQFVYQTLQDIVSNNRVPDLKGKGVDMQAIQEAMNKGAAGPKP